MKLYIIWTLILFALLGLFNAVMDVIDHKFYTSIFSRIKNEKIRVWFRSWYSDKSKAWYIPSQIKDGWHCSKGLIGLALVADKVFLFFVFDLSIAEIVVLCITYIIVLYLVFRLFYERILIVRDKRTSAPVEYYDGAIIYKKQPKNGKHDPYERAMRAHERLGDAEEG